jgi:hypothetical protein
MPLAAACTVHGNVCMPTANKKAWNAGDQEERAVAEPHSDLVGDGADNEADDNCSQHADSVPNADLVRGHSYFSGVESGCLHRQRPVRSPNLNVVRAYTTASSLWILVVRCTEPAGFVNCHNVIVWKQSEAMDTNWMVKA